MWDIISYDFDATISEEKCLLNVLQNIKPGSIIVFHDSEKCIATLQQLLPKYLDYLKKEGYLSRAIEQHY